MFRPKQRSSVGISLYLIYFIPLIALREENAPFTSILNENSTAIAAIQGAVSSIVDSITKTSQAIQAAPADKRQSTSTDPVTQIEYILNDIAFGLVSALLSVVGTITGCKLSTV
jgi:hypothetical protein